MAWLQNLESEEGMLTDVIQGRTLVLLVCC